MQKYFQLRDDLAIRGRWHVSNVLLPTGREPLLDIGVPMLDAGPLTATISHPGQRSMVALNSIRVVRCLDENRSEVSKWTDGDHRADLAGQYRQVTKLTLAPGAVPTDAQFFRVEGWLVALIISEAVKEAMERIGCVGATFIEL